MIGLDSIWCIGTGSGKLDLVISDGDFYIQIKCAESVADFLSRAKNIEAKQAINTRSTKLPTDTVEGFHELLAKYRRNMWSSEQQIMDQVASFISR